MVRVMWPESQIDGTEAEGGSRIDTMEEIPPDGLGYGYTVPASYAATFKEANPSEEMIDVAYRERRDDEYAATRVRTAS